MSCGEVVWEKGKEVLPDLKVGDGVAVDCSGVLIKRVVTWVGESMFDCYSLNGEKEVFYKGDIVRVWRNKEVVFTRKGLELLDVIKEQYARVEVDKEALKALGRMACSNPDYESFQRKLDELKRELK